MPSDKMIISDETIATLSRRAFFATTTAAQLRGLAIAQSTPVRAAVVNTDFSTLPPYGNGTKYRDRMATACHTIASLVVNYAIRRQFAAVRYDDSDRTFCEQFPWFELKLKVAEKCDAAGVHFEHVSKCRD